VVAGAERDIDGDGGNLRVKTTTTTYGAARGVA